MSVRNYVFVKSFAYEERFRDIVTTQSVGETVRRTYGVAIERVAGTLADKRSDDMSAAQLSAAIRGAFDPVVNKYLEVLRQEGLGPFLVDKGLQTELEAALEPASIAARAADVVPPPTGQDLNTWRQTIADAVDDASRYAEGSDELLEEELFGAFGLGLFAHYEFAIDLSLPGILVESNATSREGNALKWAFTNDAFLGNDYVLRARSRIIYPQRIAVAGAALVALLAGWWVKSRTSESDA